jgi:hypothetical protein
MKIRCGLIIVAALALGLPGRAQAPAGSTGLCKDGTYTTAAKKRGACSDHGGVKAWFGAPIPQAAPVSLLAPPASPQISTPVTSQSPVAASGDAQSAPPRTVAPPPALTPTPSSEASPNQVRSPADAIKVWVNLSSKVYHCPDSQWYGKTQSGKYMTQAEAVALGARPAYSKTCVPQSSRP